MFATRKLKIVIGAVYAGWLLEMVVSFKERILKMGPAWDTVVMVWYSWSSVALFSWPIVNRKHVKAWTIGLTSLHLIANRSSSHLYRIHKLMHAT